jgi:hypothetical protein
VRAPSGRSAPCVRPSRGYKHPLSRVNFLSDGGGSHRGLMGHLSVRMSVISGPASVSGEWLKEHEPGCPKPCSRRPSETQEVDNDKEMSARFGNVRYIIYDDSPASRWPTDSTVTAFTCREGAVRTVCAVRSACQRVQAPLESCQFAFGWWGISSSTRGFTSL